MGIKIKQIDGLQTALDGAGGGSPAITGSWDQNNSTGSNWFGLKDSGGTLGELQPVNSTGIRFTATDLGGTDFSESGVYNNKTLYDLLSGGGYVTMQGKGAPDGESNLEDGNKWVFKIVNVVMAAGIFDLDMVNIYGSTANISFDSADVYTFGFEPESEGEAGGTATSEGVFKFNYTAVNTEPANPGEVYIESAADYFLKFSSEDANSKSIADDFLNSVETVIVKNLTTGESARGQLTQFNYDNPLTKFILTSLSQSSSYYSSALGAIQGNTSAGDDIEIIFIQGNGVIYYADDLADVKFDAGSGMIRRRIYRKSNHGSRELWCRQGGRSGAIFGPLDGDLKSYKISNYTSVDQGGGEHKTSIDPTDFGTNDDLDYIYFNSSSPNTSFQVFVNGVLEFDWYLETFPSTTLDLTTPYPIESNDEIVISLTYEFSFPP